MKVTSIPRWLGRAAAERPDQPAIVETGGVTTYAELEAQARVLAQRLRAAGVEAGDRLGVWLPGDADFICLVHAAMACGSVLVPLNLRLRESELRPQLEDAGPRLLVCDASRLEGARSAAAGLDGIGVRTLADLMDLEPAHGEPVRGHRPESDQSVLFTSGTTGRSKGVRLTFANQLASAVASERRLGLPPDSRWLVCMPLYHVGGLAIVLRSAIAGTCVVLHPGFAAERVARALCDGEVTIASLVPTMLSRVLRAMGSRRAGSGLRTLLLGGGPISDDLIENARRSGIPIAPTYGLTEAASQVATLAPDEIEAGAGTVGRALPGLELKVVDDAGGTLPAGECGEILVRGPQVTPGYVGSAASNTPRTADGWLRTGDLGTIDAEARLTVLDRRSDLIVSGGENVYPAEVEAVLCSHPDVADAAVLPRPDPEWGQQVTAVVVPRSGASPAGDDLVAFCRRHLAGFKVPRQIEWSAGLPRTPAGKLQRQRLRATAPTEPPGGGAAD